MDTDSYDGKATRFYRPGDNDYGRSIFDVRQRFVASVNYAIPFGNNKTGPMRFIVGGWELNSILALQTGLPFHVTATDRSNTGMTSFCFIFSGIFEAAVGRAELSDTARADMCRRGERRTSGRRLVAEAMSRPDTGHPRVAGVAGNIAAFAAIYRFEFDTAHRLLVWAAPYHEMMGPFASVYGACYDGIAARYQLDIARAEASFRRAFEIGSGVGPHSHAARLAGALLGQLLYETGDLAAAMRLLDESYRLGPEGGGVDYLAARYVIGARLRAIHGDRDSAVERLSAGMRVAEQLGLQRLAAGVNNERIRLGIEIAPAVATDCGRSGPSPTTTEPPG